MVEEFASKEAAMKREYEIKQFNRKQKEEIIRQWQLKNPGLIDSYIVNNV